jgi:hypothetical protein
LLIGGNKGASNKLEKLNLILPDSSKLEYVTLQELNSSKILLELKSSEKLVYLMQSKSTDFRRQLLFIYEIGRKLHLSYSFRIRAKQMLGCHIHPKNFLGIKNCIRQNLYFKNGFMYMFFFLGFFRFPKRLLINLLTVNFSEHLILEEVFESLNLSAIVIFTAGQDNLSFLIGMLKKNNKIKYGMVILNWDNTSSKAFISQIFDKIGLWNENQICEAVKFSELSIKKLEVIGSKVADTAYSKYFTEKYHTEHSLENKLLFLGQQNRCDELAELISINNLLRLCRTPYDHLVYRPNPYGKNGRSIIDSGVLEQLGIGVNTDSDIDLREYKGIVCFPTTMLLEVILSGVPYITYTPKHSNYLFSPKNTWNYYHFNYVRSILQTPVIESSFDLFNNIKLGIPKQKTFSQNDFSKILPNFDKRYDSRLNEFVFNMLYDF